MTPSASSPLLAHPKRERVKRAQLKKLDGPDWKTLRNKLDVVFSKYIRLRDAGKGCISCGKHSPLQCGHFIKRQFLGTRWDEKNSAGQCVHCNNWLQGNDVNFAEGLRKRYGADVTDELLIRKKQGTRPPIEYLKMFTEHYEKILIAKGFAA